MSVESLKEFTKKVYEDGELKKKAKDIGLDDLEGIIDLAKENGFDISIEDFEAVAKEYQSKDELSEGDLDKVAGGFITTEAALVAGVVVGVASVATSVTAADGW